MKALAMLIRSDIVAGLKKGGEDRNDRRDRQTDRQSRRNHSVS